MTDRTEWFRAAKLGLFIHWGPYSAAGVEASWPIMVPEYPVLTGGTRISEPDYRRLPARFDPVEFDAYRWARTARNAGMRYLVFTAKHHDGFCMFDAPGTEYKITRTPFGRDVTAELAEACRSEGLRFGLYYSPPDMDHPGYRDTSRPAFRNWFGEPDRPEWAGYLDYMESQLRHLLTAYGHVDILWFDGLFEQEKYDPPRFHALIRGLSPETLVNDRLGGGGDYITPEQGIPDGVPIVTRREDKGMTAHSFLRLMRILSRPPFRWMVQRKLSRVSDDPQPLSKVPAEPFPADDRYQPWETCMTMNRTWAYSPTDTNWKSARLLLRVMARAVSRGGNFLLNVGPDSRGVFPAEAHKRLGRIGLWIKAHGEAIYGTRYGRPLQPRGLVCTRGDAAVYVFLLEGAGRDVVPLDGLHYMPEHAALLDTGQELPVLREKGMPAIGVSEVPAGLSLPVVVLR